jgi:hypothetical protein
MDTKHSSDLPPEPDLQEHQRLIDPRSHRLLCARPGALARPRA